MTTEFVLLSTQRSGSTWVTDMLNSHASVLAYGELFLKEWKERPTWAGAKDILTWNAYWKAAKNGSQAALKPLIYRQYLTEVYTPGSANVDVGAIGFKLMYGQARQHPPVLFWLRRQRVKVIHLIRRNFLDVLISEEARRLDGVAHSYDAVKTRQITIDTTTLLRDLRKKERKILWARRMLRPLGFPCLEATYEGLVKGTQGFDVILDFLGISPGNQHLNSPLRRLSIGSQRDRIQNYDQVAALLAGTAYADLLH